MQTATFSYLVKQGRGITRSSQALGKIVSSFILGNPVDHPSDIVPPPPPSLPPPPMLGTPRGRFANTDRDLARKEDMSYCLCVNCICLYK